MSKKQKFPGSPAVRTHAFTAMALVRELRSNSVLSELKKKKKKPKKAPSRGTVFKSLKKTPTRGTMWKSLSHVQLTLCDAMNYTVHGILQTKILEWVDFPFSRESTQPRDGTQVSHIAGRFFTNWTMREALMKWGLGWGSEETLSCIMHFVN